MQSFAKIAEEEAKKHPEIAAALLEFERTKKIPKFTYRKRQDITINEHVLRAFKAHCQKKQLNMSRIIEKFMKQELAETSK